jgi:AcrR family transcriptional regulator
MTTDAMTEGEMTAGEAPVRRRPRDRKERILVAAAARFGAAGFRATAVEDVAADVGITAAAIYRHFGSKDEILASVLDEAVQALLDASERAPGDGADGESSDDGPDHTLRALTRTMLGFASERTPFYASYVRERGRLSGRAQTAARRAEARLTERWREAVAEAGIALDQQRVDLRLTSVLTALREMSLSAESGDLQRHRDLVTDAIVGVWRAPTSDDPAPTPAAPGYPRPALRNQQILEAALALFRERGFHDVGMDDIAASVGMAASGIYRFYPSKADILLDAYDLVLVHVIAGMDEIFATAADALAALTGLIELQVRTALGVTDLIAVTEREGAALPESERPRLARRRREILQTHVAVLRDVRPDLSEQEARILLYGLQPLIRTAAALGADLPDPVGELVGMGLALLLVAPATC